MWGSGKKIFDILHVGFSVHSCFHTSYVETLTQFLKLANGTSTSVYMSSRDSALLASSSARSFPACPIWALIQHNVIFTPCVVQGRVSLSNLYLANSAIHYLDSVDLCEAMIAFVPIH